MSAVLDHPAITPIDYGDRLRLGIIVPSGNVIAEPQIRAMLPPGVSPLFTRLALRGTTEAELLAMMEGVEAAAGLLADARVDRIVFHCTAVTTFSPSSGVAIRERITAATGIPGLVTSDALEAALQVLGLRRIVLLSPYTLPTHRREIAFVEQLGVEVVSNAALELETNVEMARLEPETLEAWVLAHQDPRADGYFVSCTALRTAELIAGLEARLDRPVLTSNQLMVWHALRSATLDPATSSWGRLMNH
ncbi:MAG: maleate cis-trans isomerase family protein [Janthinobacterium lividum]